MSAALADTRAHNVNFIRVVRSEFIKIATLRSTWILLACTIATLIGIAALNAWGVTQLDGTGHQLPPEQIRMLSSGGVDLGVLILGSFGVVVAASEYGTGMIRSTMAFVPNRWAPIAAKAVVVAAIAFVVGIVSTFTSYLVVQPILATKGFDFALMSDGVIGSLLGTCLYLVFVTLMGLSLGSLLRNTPAGIVTIVGVAFVLPVILVAVPLDLFDTIQPYAPVDSSAQMAQIDTSGQTLNQWQGGLVGAAWTAALLIAAMVTTKKRDV